MNATTLESNDPLRGVAEQDPRPIVPLPKPGLSGFAIAGTAAVLAVLLFIVLDAQRRGATSQASRAERSQVNAFAPPPPLIVPYERPTEPAPVRVSPTVAFAAPPRTTFLVEPVRTRAPVLSPTPAQPSSPPILDANAIPQSPELPAPRLNEPALVIDDGAGQGGAAATATAAAGGAAGQVRSDGPGVGGDDTPVRASVIGNRTNIMPVGTLIPAVLETPIDTARPGLVRAVVSQDARGFDGRRVLVPRGSRLIGEYQADVRSGQNRVLVTWNRLIRPDGVAIRLSSPAADSLGGAGVPGRVNTFFFQRFAAAVLQSALTVGVNLASRPGNGSVIVGLPSGPINNVVGQDLLPSNDLRPKIRVKQGAAMNVFVARDLDFSGVATRP